MLIMNRHSEVAVCRNKQNQRLALPQLQELPTVYRPSTGRKALRQIRKILNRNNKQGGQRCWF